MKRHCSSCGQTLAPNANFCRACGTKYSPPATPTTTPTTPDELQGRNRTAIAAIAILIVGAGVAAAILLAGGGGSPTTTVIQSATGGRADAATGGVDTIESEEAADSTSANPITAGRYVQAGSFQTAAHAEIERSRLAKQGVDAAVVSADDAQQLYPGFQVLIVGPVDSHAEEVATLQALHRNGVPSAFAQELTPAEGDVDPGSMAGSWSGELELTSAEHPDRDGALPVTLTVAEGGATGTIDFRGNSCHTNLSLASSGGPVVSYVEGPPCAEVKSVQTRLTGNGMMVTLLSPGTGTFARGTLNGG